MFLVTALTLSVLAAPSAPGLYFEQTTIVYQHGEPTGPGVRTRTWHSGRRMRLEAGDTASGPALVLRLDLDRAWRLDPGSIEVAINLGGAYVMQGRHEKAANVLEEASRREPKNVMIWINLAAAYLGRLEDSSEEGQLKAITAFEKALALNPEAPSVNYNLGLIYIIFILDFSDDLLNKILHCNKA